MTAAALHARLITHGAPAGHVGHLAHGPARLTLRADTPAVIPAVTAALHAYLPTASGAGWTLTVRTTARIDTDLAAAVCTGAAVDVGPAQLAHPCTLPAAALWWLPQPRILVYRDNERREVTLTGHPEPVRPWAARLARQLVTAQLVDAGAVHAHAAAFAHRGGGVLIAGLAGAGKTTCLLAGLRATDGHFVANDRVLLLPDSTGLTAYAWPAPLRAAPGTLRAVDGLDVFTHARGEQEKTDIDPALLAGRVGSGITGSTCPRLMLWPARTRNPHQPEAVPADEVRATLANTRLFLHDPDTGRSSHLNHWLVPLPDFAALDQARDTVIGLLAALPCVRIAVTDDIDQLIRDLNTVLTTVRSAATTPVPREQP
ncbi:hypothetical protein C8D87_11435 [Lentzea atacamensis]|uniref:Uncharacterized protein n=2 Tax=Lentzea atacamensis TaxID=531938 RepID=A0ABX9DVU5_9PSEU|nr:hypothetical protein C8D87_11435 [Lentzea atacamensis]